MRFIAMLSTIIASVSTFATPLANEQSKAMERVTVTNSNHNSQSIDIIDENLLNRINATHIEQVMTNISGANFARGNGIEYLPALRSPVLTGAGACGSILTMSDNVALRAAGFCNINELFEAPFQFADSIEVYKGVQSAAFGSNAQNGVINVITPEVLSEDLIAVKSTISSNDDYSANIDTNHADSNLRGQLLVTKNGGWRQASGYEQQKLQLKHFYQGRNATITSSFNLNHLNQQTATYIVGKDAYKDEQLAEQNLNPEAYRDAYSLRASSNIDTKLNDDIVLSVTPYIRHTDMTFLMHFLPGQPIESTQTQSVGVKSQIALTTFDPVDLMLGLDGEYTDASVLQYQIQPTEGSDFLKETIPQGKHYDYKVKASNIAPFARINWRLYDSLNATGGIRFDHQKYDYKNDMLNGRTDEFGVPCGFGGCRYSRPEDREDSFDNTSWQIGLHWQATSKINAFVDFGNGFRAPQATELYRLQRDQKVADLDSEHTEQIQIGLSRLAKDSYIKLVAYYSEKDDIIFRDSNAFNVSGGKTRHKGIELDYRLKLFDGLTFISAASYSAHNYRNVVNDAYLSSIATNMMDSAPRWISNSKLIYQFNDALIIELEHIFQDEYFTDASNLHEYDGHQLINTRASYQYSQHLAISVRALNRLEEAYADRADFSGFSGDRYFPGLPRTLYVDVSYTF